MGGFTHTCQTNYSKKLKTMKDETIRKLWEEFINDENYKYYFQLPTMLELFNDNLNKLKTYIDTYNQRPSQYSKDKPIKSMGHWIGNCQINYSKKINNMSFHLVGGLEKDIAYWQSYVDQLKLSNVYFYGFVSPKETSRYRNSFDIVLAPYAKKVTIEGYGDTSKFMSPIKIFEYMSHKKVIIASDLPVIREVLSEKNSILINYENVELWINSIKNLEYSKLYG